MNRDEQRELAVNAIRKVRVREKGEQEQEQEE
jgi:hypothetical protein